MSHHAEHTPHPQTRVPDPAMQRAPQAPRTEPAHAPREPGTSAGPDPKPGPDLIPQGDQDKLALRLQQALNTFVDNPRHAVEEADAVLDDVATQFTNALTEQRRVLRAGWQDTGAQTEELRLALRQYRQITERLLHMSAPASH
ncbi:hypothetical protein [Streptomyces sp. NPDC050534]|uniref:hypothetical protein n=1 Tax=Streptomyces sp. NPDC050534 TaxID=3365625 RepID=UPI0037BC45E4